MVPGGQQAVGQGSVIGEQEQALGVLVQPSRREEPYPAQMLGSSSSTVGWRGSSVADTSPAGLWSIR